MAHIGRLWWGRGVSLAGHNWVRIEWRTPLYPRTSVFAESVWFWEMQWR